ncbi:MAG: enoyl-CoA hydratase/isomerase family protein [Pseudomonadota bacterium]|nr:enoyl-CoA hydratase/isomerase family protein [Pseudomonadota bacterium]
MSPLLVEHVGDTLSLTLNRPDKMNALSATLVDALLAAVEPAEAQGVRLLVLRGNGRNFSAGFDFGDVQTQSEADLLLRFTRIEQLLQVLHHAPYETVALAQGRNFGAGVDLIGACSVRIATADASFRMPGLRFGVVLGSRRFAAQVGAETARAILTEARTFGTDEALRIGFIHRVAGQAEWPSAIAAVEANAAALSADTAARLRRALRADTRDADLAELVRSVAQPGIHGRIAAYLATPK